MDKYELVAAIIRKTEMLERLRETLVAMASQDGEETLAFVEQLDIGVLMEMIADSYLDNYSIEELEWILKLYEDPIAMQLLGKIARCNADLMPRVIEYVQAVVASQ